MSSIQGRRRRGAFFFFFCLEAMTGWGVGADSDAWIMTHAALFLHGGRFLYNFLLFLFRSITGFWWLGGVFAAGREDLRRRARRAGPPPPYCDDDGEAVEGIQCYEDDVVSFFLLFCLPF